MDFMEGVMRMLESQREGDAHKAGVRIMEDSGGLEE